MIEPEQVAVPEVPEMEGNRMADMPENPEGGNERNGNAEMTNGPGSPESRKEGVAMMGLVIIWNEARPEVMGTSGKLRKTGAM